MDDDGDAEDFLDPTLQTEFEMAEAERLISLVKDTSLQQTAPPITSLPPEIDAEHPLDPKAKSTTITDDDAVRKAKRRRKKLLKQLTAIQKLKDMEVAGRVLNQEQRDKVAKQEQWAVELDSVEHNLK